MAQIGRRHPIPEHTRLDGRHVYPVSALDFRAAERPAPSTSQAVLLPGGLIGLTASYHYTGNGGSDMHPRITLFGRYTGITQPLSIPIHSRHPSHPRQVIQNAPVFDFVVAADELRNVKYGRVPIGRITIACLQAGQQAKAAIQDPAAIQEALGLQAVPSSQAAHLGKVVAGTLFYTTPPDLEIAARNGLVLPPAPEDPEQTLAFSFAPYRPGDRRRA